MRDSYIAQLKKQYPGVHDYALGILVDLYMKDSDCVKQLAKDAIKAGRKKKPTNTDTAISVYEGLMEIQKSE